MADAESNIRLGIDTSDALASLKALQRQLSLFQKEMAASSAANANSAKKLQRSLIDDINATGKFSASMKTIRSTSESFTNALEKNKLSMGEYFRFAGGATKRFGHLFKSEFDTINKVARERVKDLQTQYVALGRDASGALKSIAIRPMSLDMQNLGTQTAIAAQRQQLFNQLLKQGSTNLLNFGKNTQWAGRQLMVGFTIPLSIFGSMASKSFMEIEQQAIRFKRVYGDAMTTAAQTDEALQSIEDLAKSFTKYGIEISKTIELAADAAQMGLQGADLREQVANATRLAVLGEVEQQEALKTSVAITNTFGTATEDLANKINFLNIVENETMTAISDLTTAIPKAGPVIKQLGGDVEDLAFFLTAMKEGGINASEGANALKSGLASVINPTRQSIDLLKAFNINITQIRDANRGDVKGLFIDLAQALDQLDPTQRAQAIEQLFGKFQFARISTLFKNIVQEGTQAQRVLELTNATTAELAQLSDKELRRVEQSTTFRFKSATEQFQAAIAPIGEEFLKLITPLIEFGTKVANAFNNLSDNAKQFITGLTFLLGAIGPIALMTFGLLANGVANIIKGFAAVQGIFLKTGRQSSILGEQIDYMTQEQLQAAAVASSLDQTHSKLIQTLSTEAGVVKRLGDIYLATWKKQQKFDTGRRITARTGFDPKTLNLASGIVSVPGPKGAGDIVPAMLSPGEAIIPADAAAKYAPLIAGMVKDNIPGFERSNVKVIGGGKVAMPGGGVIDAGTDAKAKQLSRLVDHLYEALLGMGNSADQAEARLMELAESAADSKGKVSATSLDKVVKENDRSLDLMAQNTIEVRKRLEKATLIKGNEGAASLHLSDPKRLSNPDREDLLRQLEEQGYGNHPSAKKLRSGRGLTMTSDAVMPAPAIMNKSGKITGTEAAAIVKENKGMLTADIAAALKLDPNDPVLIEIEKNAETMLAKAGDKILTSKEIEDALYQSVVNATKKVKGKSADAISDHLNKKKIIVGGRTGQARASLPDGFNATLPSGMTVGGPSSGSYMSRGTYKEFHDVAENATLNVAAKIAGKKIVKKAGDEVAKGVDEAAQSNSPSRRAKRAGKNIADGAIQGIEEGAKKARGAGRGVSAAGGLSQGLTSLTNKLGGVSFALSSLAGAGMFAGGQIGEMSAQLFQVSSAMTALIMVTELLTKAKLGSLIAERSKKANIALRALNAFGDGGGKGLSGLLTRAGVAVRAFMGPIGLATVAIGAFAAMIAFAIKIQNDQKDAINGLGDTAYLTAEKMKKAGELLGFTPNTIAFGQNIKAGTAAARGTQEAGMISQLRSSDDFKKTFDTEIKAIKNATKGQAELALQSVSNQLFAAGASQEQVDAYVRAIAQEAERTDLSFNFAAIDFSADGVKSIVDASKKGAETYSTMFGKYVKTYFTKDGDLIPEMTNYGAEGAQGIQAFAGTLASSFQSLKDGLANGLLSADSFNEGITGIRENLQSLDADELQVVLPELYKDLGIEELMEGIPNVKDQLLLLEADAAGIKIPEADKNALKNADKSARSAAAAAKVRAKIVNLVKNQAKEQENLNQKTEEERILNEEIQNAKNSLEERTTALKNQTEAYAFLIEKGYDAETAFELAGDAGLAAGIAAALGFGMASDEIDEVLLKIEDYLAATKAAPKAPNSAGSGSKSPYQLAIDSLKEQRDELKNNLTAFNKLRDAGLNIRDAFNLAQDTVLATALASTKVGTAAWFKLLDTVKKLNAELSKSELLKLLQEGKIAKEFKQNQIAVSSALVALGYSYDQIQQVLQNEELTNSLAKDLEDGKINAKELQWALAQIQQMEDLEFNLNITTKEGAQQEFQKLYDKAVGFLNAKRTVIEVDAQLKAFDDQQIVREAEDTIAGYTEDIDDLDAQLVGIQKQEDEINEQYENRIEALDKVQTANERIAKQQKGQLTLADALSQGDIAAAARAAQEMRAQSAQDSVDDQKQALELARDARLAAVRSEDGRSRLELENEIADIKDKIFKLEEETLEPARKRIRLIEVEKNDALASLDLQILKWDALSAKVNEAKLKLTPEEMTALEYQAGLIADLLKNWDSVEDKTATLTIIKKTVEEGSSSGSSSSSSSSSSGPGPNTDTDSGSSGNAADSTDGYYQIGPDGRPIIDGVPVGGSSVFGSVTLDPKGKDVNATKTAIVKQAETMLNKANSDAKVASVLSKVPGMTAVANAMKESVTLQKKDAVMLSKAAQNIPTKQTGSAGGGGGAKLMLLAKGGLVPKFGTDTVPAMLTPGEFVVSKYGVQKYGVDRLKAINSGTSSSDSVYNYSVSVNVDTNANPDQIARAVITQIKQIDSQRIRSNRF